jgi:HSP20 family protein
MLMSQWNPSPFWGPLGELQREFGRLLRTLDPATGAPLSRPFPLLNLFDAGDRFVLQAEVPGVAPSEIDIALTGDNLTLRGERKRADGVADEAYRRQERPSGRWSRTITLPGRVDPAGVVARCDNGLLTITFPKSADTQPRQIVVGTSASPMPGPVIATDEGEGPVQESSR